MTAFLRRLGLFVFLSACVTPHLRGQLVVRKEFRKANPLLAIGRFEGPAPVRKRLDTVLTCADWFDLVGDPRKAEYVLGVRYEVAGGSHRVTFQAARGGQTVFSRTYSHSDRDRALFHAVDGLIESVFGVPGPCSGMIAYAAGGQQQRKEVFVCNFDGSDAERLTHNGTISTEPSWSRDGKTLVYTLYRDNATSVVQVDMVGRRQRRLSRFPGLNAGASLSRDAAWIALSLSVERRVDLYLVPVGSGEKHQVTRDHAVESSPCWSPKGGNLCYVSDKVGNPQLYIVPARGGSSVRVLREYDEAVSPDWSPVSNRLCFSTRIGRQYRLGVVDMGQSGRERELISRAAGDWESPSWAPDGRHVVCSRRTGGTRNLYIVDTWHGTLRQITRGRDHSLPSWSRRR